MENENKSNNQAEPVSKKQGRGIASLLSVFDTAGEAGMRKVFFNFWFVLFLVVLAGLHIANNHLAVKYARTISKKEKEVKLLRWRYMTSSSSLMQKSKQSAVANLVNAQGLKQLRIPPYKIETEEK